MMEEKEFWTLGSENVPFQKGWFYRAFDMQKFMEKIEADPRGGKIIGMKFQGVRLFAPVGYAKAGKAAGTGRYSHDPLPSADSLSVDHWFAQSLPGRRSSGHRDTVRAGTG